jgi:hypothetical protein
MSIQSSVQPGLLTGILHSVCVDHVPGGKKWPNKKDKIKKYCVVKTKNSFENKNSNFLI